MRKRITAAILIFILLMNSSVTAFATDGGSATGNNPVSDIVSDTEIASVSGNEFADEEGDSAGEANSEAESEISTPETEEMVPQESEEPESETALESDLVPVVEESVSANNVAPRQDAFVYEAKSALQKLAEQKAIYALVYLTDSYDIKVAPKSESATVATVPSAQTVQILDVEVERETDGEKEQKTIWYYVQFYVGDMLRNGYIEDEYLACSDELLLEWKNRYQALFYNETCVSSINASYETYAAVSYKDVDKFPVSYQVYLRKLKEEHPNWTFVKMDVGRDWEDCVNEQKGNYSWIYYNQPEKFRGKQINSTWYYASEEGIAYYMDPRNFLTDAYIFQFEQNTYNASYHTQDALQAFLANTFMKGKVPDKSESRTYAKVIFNSGKSRKLSPFNLAARVIQEQGINGTSAMISGKYSGFEGYYNYYNISASGKTDTEVIRNGLAYAKEKGWNTRVKSLEGGAEFIGNGYILQGQDTLYLQKFDVMHGSSSLHQYMQNIMAPYTEGQSMRKMYNNAGALNSAFVFKIPVFDDMPTLGYEMATSSPVKLKKGKTKQISIKYNGISISDLSIFTFKSDNPEIATVSSTGKITAVGTGADYSGKTNIRITLKEDTDISFSLRVVVTNPLVDISLEADDSELFYLTEDMPEDIPYVENGETKYRKKTDCPTETIVSVVYNPADTTDERKVKWTIADEKVVSLEALDADASKVRLTAKEGGTTLVTAKVGDFTASIEINVRIPMTDAWIAQKEITLHKGQKARVLTSYTPYNTTDTVEPEWISSDENVVKIVDGEMVAVGKGTAIVRASIGPFVTVGGNDEDAAQLSCSVTVEEYTVTFMDETDSILAKAPGSYGSTLAKLDWESKEAQVSADPWTISKDGYVFAGWYTDKNGEGNPVTQESVLYQSMTLYPYFISVNERFTIKPIGSVIYTGGYLKPTVVVYDGEKRLEKGKDYTVSYVNNKDVCDIGNSEDLPKAVVIGRGGYAGCAAEESFIIVPKNIADIDVTSSNVTVAYDGKVHKIQPFIRDAGRILQKDTDYELKYPAEVGENGTADEDAYKQPGTYPIEVIGKGNYVGNRKVYITITKRVSVTELTVSEIKDVTYNDGDSYIAPEAVKAWEPKPGITYQKKTLTEGVDYTLDYEDNKEIGTARIIISGKGNYFGTRTVNFRIKGNDITTVLVSGIQNAEYTAKPFVPGSVVVKNSKKKLLTEGKDYTLLFENNTEVGKAYAIITGINGYSGEIKIPFYIEAYDIAKNVQTYQTSEGNTKEAFEVVCGETAEYEKAGAKPAVSVFFKGEELKEGTDYKLSYKNNHQTVSETDGAKPTVVITGKGRFTGAVEKTFSITPKDISTVSMSVKDVLFRNRKGFCFALPVLKDTSNRRLKEGVDYAKELVYTYETDVVLYDGTVRLAGAKVEENDIPTAGELEDAFIRVTANGMGNYTGEISAVYRILKNTSWFENWTEEETPKLHINRTRMYLNCLYPEYGDSVKLESSTGRLLEEKTVIECANKDAEDRFLVVLEDGKLSVSLKGSRDEALAGVYTFTITPMAEIEGEEVLLPKRTVQVNVSDEKPKIDMAISGNIDLLYRDTTAVSLEMKMLSETDSFFLPVTEEEMNAAYALTGEGSEEYRIDYNSSVFTKDSLVLCLKALSGAETLSPHRASELVLQYKTDKGIILKQEFAITPKQTEYRLVPKTEKCYIKTEEGKGQILITSTPGDITYESIECDDERVGVSLTGNVLVFTLADGNVPENEEEWQVTVRAYAKDAARDTEPAVMQMTLVFCEKTELEKLVDSKDEEKKTLEQRRESKTSYQETKEINNYDKKLIAANTIDFSDTKIAFLGDSITAGVGLEKIGIEENVYTSVVKRSLNLNEVYRLGYGGYGMSHLGDSLLEKYENIPIDTDIIFVFAGINDVYDGSEAEFGNLTNLSSGTFCGDTYRLMTSLKNRHPDAEIIFLTPLSSITNTWYQDALPDMLPMKRYVNAMNAIGEMTGITVWDLYNENFLDSYDKNILSKYMQDGVHPGVAGHRVLGEHIAGELIRMKMMK